MPKFISKQVICQTINNTLDYISPEKAEIRAFTMHNPTDQNIECTVAVSGIVFIKKTVTAGATETLSLLFNQQIGKDNRLTIAGDGLNVCLTVVEIVE